MRRSAAPALVLAVAVVAAGCDDKAKPKPKIDRVTKAEYARLHNGMKKRQVRRILGRPDGRYSVPYPTPGELDEGFEDCWNYGITTQPETPLYQLCFWGGKLTSFTRYG